MYVLCEKRKEGGHEGRRKEGGVRVRTRAKGRGRGRGKKKLMHRNVCPEERMWQKCLIFNKICFSPSMVYY